MDSTHQQIPTSDQYEETTSLKEEVDVEKGTGSSETGKPFDKKDYKPFDINDDPCIKRLNALSKVVFVIFCIVSVISLVKVFTGYHFYTDMYGKGYYADTTMLNVSLPDTTSIEGSLATIGESRSPRCEDYQYGCCEIYDTCSVSSGEFSATSLPIDPRIVHKHDAVGTNCPRVIDMIGKYMDNYGKTSCASSEYGCCELNFICDMREYVRNYHNESKHQVAHVYQTNVMHGTISESLGIAKLNEEGSNCPQHYNLIMEYESGNLNKSTRVNPGLLSIAIILGLATIMLLCNIICGNRKR
jgi:hypothetical protein